MSRVGYDTDTYYESWMAAWVFRDTYKCSNGLSVDMYVAYAPDCIEPVYISSEPEHVYRFMRGYAVHE